MIDRRAEFGLSDVFYLALPLGNVYGTRLYRLGTSTLYGISHWGPLNKFAHSKPLTLDEFI